MEITDLHPDFEFTILFDVSRLANTRLKFSGISRYAREMLLHLADVEGVDVKPVLMDPAELDKGEFRDDLHGFSRYLGANVIRPEQAALLGKQGRTVYFSPYAPFAQTPKFSPPTRCVTVHDLLHLSLSEHYLLPGAARNIQGVLDALSPADYVLTVSEFTRMQLLQHVAISPDHVRTVPLGVSEAFSRQDADGVARFCKANGLEPNRYFVMFAQQDPRKNVATTTEAMRRFLIDNPDTPVSFLVVGSGVNLERTRDSFERAQLPAEKFTLLSAPEDRELALAYSGARALLYPSLGEGFGLPPLEAMRCGCPVITSALTSLPEVVRGAGEYVDPTDGLDIKAAIERLAASDSRVAELSRQALAASEGYGWAAAARKTAAFLRHALSVNTTRILGLAALHLAPAGPSLLPDAPAWTGQKARVVERNGVPTIGQNIIQSGGANALVRVLVEDASTGRHSLSVHASSDASRLRSSVIVRAAERENLVLWVTQVGPDGDVAWVDLYVDMKAMTVERSRARRGAELHSATVSDLGDGWLRIVVESEWPALSEQKIRLSVGGRTSSLTSSAYLGEGLEAFALLDARIEDITDTHAGAANGDAQSGVFSVASVSELKRA